MSAGGDGFVRDPQHWLLRYSADEWVRAALAELARAERAYRSRDARGGLACARRAAGMALNGALVVEPDPGWGRSYVDHLRAVAADERVPAEVSAGAKLLLEAPAPGGAVVALRTPAGDERVLEATRTVMAHAYARVKRVAPPPAGGARGEES